MNIFKLFKSNSMSSRSSMLINMQEDTDTESNDGNSVLKAAISEGNQIENNLRDFQEKEQLLENKIISLEKKNSDFMNVVSQYDDIVKQLLQERNIYREGVNILATHLACLELSFNDVQLKYERAKKIVGAFEENEKTLKDAILEYKNTQDLLEKRYITLKDWCDTQLQSANGIINKLRDEHTSELYWLKAKIESLEIRRNTLEENFKQKCIENKRLSTLYDNLCLIPEQENNNT